MASCAVATLYADARRRRAQIAAGVTAMDTILVVNAGSSSVKFQVFALDGDGQAAARRSRARWTALEAVPACAPPDRMAIRWPTVPIRSRALPDVPAAMLVASAWLRDELQLSPLAVGHRVVHGGPDYDRPVVIDHGVVARLERFAALAPLHQPHNLAPIRSLLANFPSLPQVACFDTAFHRDHDEVADHYAIPRRLHDEGVRRYGFHGLSYEYIAKTLPNVAPEIASGACHRRSSGQWRLDVRYSRRPERGEHDGIYRARWTSDGNADRPDRSRRHSLSHDRKGNVACRGAGLSLSRLRTEGTYPA